MTIQRARAGLLVILVLALLWVFAPDQRAIKAEFPSDLSVVARTKATMEEKRENKALIISYLNALGYNKNQQACAISLWTRESRLDHLADNPRSTAYGIAQMLRERSSQPELQILHAVRYVEHRYSGSFCSAKRHSDRVGWY
jgi:DNA integrity scanning protein DisA with diadenylate cyclase activity